MSMFTSVSPQREVLHAAMTGVPASFGSVGGVATSTTGATGIVGECRRYPNRVEYEDVQADLDLLIDRTIAALEEADPVEDEILGRYVHLASLARAVCFREGKLLELAVERLAKANPNITVLTQSLRLPLVKAALEAVSGNNWSDLDGIKLDCEAPSKGSYTPDLIILNRARRIAYILDLKRSLASYGDTSRLEELKLKMMASAMVLPDWLYKNHKRIMVDTVEVAIIDGASRPSDHANGVWALSEIDDLLEIDGTAACMAELRLRFADRVQRLLSAEAQKAIRVEPVNAAASTSATPAELSASFADLAYCHDHGRGFWSQVAHYTGQVACHARSATDVEPQRERITVGFARRARPD
jgi:hypothetical protein